MPRTRKEIVFFILGGFFLTNAIIAELTGGKLFVLPDIPLGFMTVSGLVLSIGVIPWPVVFISTDLINEYFGKEGVRKLTLLAVGMISYCFFLLYLAMMVPTWEHSPVSADNFNKVFGQSRWIIVGSLTAFVVSQLVDVFVFHSFKSWTGAQKLWLRATGSTVVSQAIDSFIVGYIGFVLPGNLTMEQFIPIGISNYLFKVAVAIAITPLIYLGHSLIDRYLGEHHDHTNPMKTPDGFPMS